MDFRTLKVPAEAAASKTKAFKSCLALATDLLAKKDFIQAELVYGSILNDLHKEWVIEEFKLNHLDVFSLHCCFAYSCVATNSEQASRMLDSLGPKAIQVPLVPYLKAFIHVSKERYFGIMLLSLDLVTQ